MNEALSSREAALDRLIRLESILHAPDFDADPVWRIASARDHRLVTEYVAGVTRWRRWLDFILAAYYRGERATDLGIRHSHPDWMVRRWLERYGDETVNLLKWNNERPVHSVRINTLKTSRERFIEMLEDAGIAWEPGRYLEDFIRLPSLQPIVRGPFLKEGWCAVQDESAGLIVRLLDPQPGETVLDLCAAPGGKTLYAAALMRAEGRLLAFDVQPDRMRLLDRVKSRYEAGFVETAVCDIRTLDPGLVADRVLLDAPCSGLGVLSKRADLRWRRKPGDIRHIATVQRALLEAAARHVRPGGVLVYGTCTIEPEENEAQIDAFLAAHPEFAIVDATQRLPAGLATERGGLATFPPRHGVDGAFGVVLHFE